MRSLDLVSDDARLPPYVEVVRQVCNKIWLPGYADEGTEGGGIVSGTGQGFEIELPPSITYSTRIYSENMSVRVLRIPITIQVFQNVRDGQMVSQQVV